ncbi:MAG TPA: transporter [Pyrinomonadaceae bacterium]|nr:transporter [Pyrinomonadaceae bacterium]
MKRNPRRERIRVESRMRAARVLSVIIFLAALPATLRAQQMLIPVTDVLPAQGSGKAQQEEEDFIKPSRPGIANPAEIHKAGVLQLEYGYDGNFRAEEFRSEETAPLTLRFAATERLLLELDLDTVTSERDETGERMTGIGDLRLGFQLVALKDTEKHPALAFAYYVKLPTASEEKNLGTGRFDHRLVLLISKKLGPVDMDLNGAYLIVGREDAPGWVTGGQGAIAFSGEFKNGLGLIGEFSAQSKEDAQPRGAYALGALTFKANRRLIFDAGARFGLNPDAPRFGLFAGMTVGVADLHRKK